MCLSLFVPTSSSFFLINTTEESWTKYKKNGIKCPFSQQKLHLAKSENDNDYDDDPVHLKNKNIHLDMRDFTKIEKSGDICLGI